MDTETLLKSLHAHNARFVIIGASPKTSRTPCVKQPDGAISERLLFLLTEVSQTKHQNLLLQKEAQEARNALVYFDYRRIDYVHLLQFARENNMEIRVLRRTPAGRVFHAAFQVPSHMWYT